MGRDRLKEEELQRLRDVSIHSILGIPNRGRKINMDCPFHNEATIGAFWLYPDNTFHCFSCSAHGNNAVDWVTSLGMNFEDGLLELIKYL